MAPAVCTEACFDAGRRAEWCARCQTEVRPLDALPRGEKAAGYAVGRILGRGGFAYTYLAYDEDLDRLLAIKEFYPEGIATRDSSLGISARTGRASEVFGSSLESFLGEARRLARIRHPGVVQVVRYKAERGTAYLAMPYYAGDTLQGLHERRVDAGRRSDPRELIRMLAPVFDALEHLHAQEPALLHRDIKPDNIFVEERGGAFHPLLIDFGAAREAVGKSRLSRVWTPGFAPYEQQVDMGARQGPHTDVYALAATIYYVLSDVIPPDAGLRLGGFEDGDPMQPLSTLRPDVPVAVSEALERALRMRTTERTPTIGALRHELESALGITSTGGTTSARGLEDAVARAERERIAEEQRRREAEEAEIARQEEEARRALADVDARRKALEESRQREAAERARLEREQQARLDEERRAREARDQAAREAQRRREHEERDRAAARAEGAPPGATRRVVDDPAPTSDAGTTPPPRGAQAPARPAAPAAPGGGGNRGLLIGGGVAVAALALVGVLYVNGTFSGGGGDDAIAVAPDTVATAPAALTAADSSRIAAEEDSLAEALAGAGEAAPAGADDAAAPTPAAAPKPAPSAAKPVKRDPPPAERAPAERAPAARLAAIADELKVGRVDEQSGSYLIAARSYNQAIASAQALVARYPGDKAAKSALAEARGALARARRACQAERTALGSNISCP